MIGAQFNIHLCTGMNVLPVTDALKAFCFNKSF